MKKNRHFVKLVERGSIAQELGISEGDELLTIDGREVCDVFDYQYLIHEENILVVIRKPDGEEWELEIEKEYEEDLGITFEQPLLDEYRSCSNNCIFCFIDQMPPGMRETLYFKDDDSRLSFLQGNYVTLTNMKDQQLDRLIQYHLEPINVSVHATDPDLRCRMLKNRFAGSIMDQMRRLKNAGIHMNGQIVLCKGWNDGEQLDRTLTDLMTLQGELQSVSIVPVGLSRYREGLTKLLPFTKEDAKTLLRQIEPYRGKCFEKYKNHMVHAADEWYLLANEAIPEADQYDAYPQLENGVGMLRLLQDEFAEALYNMDPVQAKGPAVVATGCLAFDTIQGLAISAGRVVEGLQVSVVPIINHFFGESITVAGLLTGTDIVAQLTNIKADRLILTTDMLRSGEEVLLDDLSITQIEEQTGMQVRITDGSGDDLLRAMVGLEQKTAGIRRQNYEQTDRSDRRSP